MDISQFRVIKNYNESLEDFYKRSYRVICHKDLESTDILPGLSEYTVLERMSTMTPHYMSKEKTWNILYFFIGEVVKEVDRTGIQSPYFKIHKGNNEISIDKYMTFTLMAILRARLDVLGKLKGSGLPDWFKDLKYVRFQKHFDFLMSRADLRKKMLKGLGSSLDFVRTQKDALRLIKGSLKGKIEDVISICKERAPGKHKKCWTNEKLVIKKADELYKKTIRMIQRRHIEIRNDEYLAKMYRITKRKCLKYLLYLGLMGTIQYRKTRSIEIHARTEQDFFSHAYIFLRQAARELGYLQLTDETFCPGVKSMSFRVKIMQPAGLKLNTEKLQMNQRELEFHQSTDKIMTAMKFSDECFDYLSKKSSIYTRIMLTPKVKSRLKSNRFSILNYGKQRGPDYVARVYKEINDFKYGFRKLSKDCDNFIRTFGTVRKRFDVRKVA